MGQLFPASAIAVAFVAMFALILFAEPADKRGWQKVSSALFFGILFAALYSFVAGLYLWTGWEVPLADADPATLAKVAARPRAGIVIFAIKVWPYVLMLAGGFFGYSTASILWRRRKPISRHA